MSKFKVGDKVRVVGNTNRHGYKIGDVVTLHFLYDNPSPHWRCGDWFVMECDMETIEDAQEFNPVSKPSHYNQYGIEAIDAIRASLGPAGFQAYCKGNVIKYLWRYEYKNGLEDLKKAQVYLNWMVESKEDNE